MQDEQWLKIYRDTVHPLYGYLARRTGGNRALTEDIVQESYLRALDRWKGRAVPDAPLAWLKQVARNILIDVLRRKKWDADAGPARAEGVEPRTPADEFESLELFMAVAALGAGQTLTETYTYTVSDGHGGTATATLTITINGANNAPVANVDANSIDEGTASISANAASWTLLNDTDLNSDPLTVTALGAGAGQPLAGLTPVPSGGAAVSGVYGQLQLLPDGS